MPLEARGSLQSLQRDHHLRPSTRAEKSGSGRVAGPLTSVPLLWKREPWQGQSRVAPGAEGSSTVQPWCVQVRDTATTLVSLSRVTARFRFAAKAATV